MDEEKNLIKPPEITAAQVQQIKQKSIVGAASYFLRTIILQVIGLIAVFALSAFFTPEDFAIYGFVVVIIGILTFFSDVGFAAALVQQKTQPSLRDLRTVFTVQQGLSWMIVLVCILIVVSGVITDKVGTAGQYVLLSLALSFPLASLKTIPSILLERELLFSKLVIPQIVEQFLFQGILVFLAWKGMGVMAYTYAILARSLGGVAVMYALRRWSLGLDFSKDSFRRLFSFGLAFQLNDLLARIKDNLFYLLLGFWLPLKEFGYIQWAKNWSMYPYNLTVQNVMAITFPTFARLQTEKTYLQKAVETTIFFITLTIFPMLALMCILVFPFVELFPVYSKWQPALLSFVFFTASIAWSAISTPLTNTLNAIGKINQTLKLMIMWTALTWIVTPICVYFLGYNGVAFAAFLISFSSIASVFMVKKYLEIRVLDAVWRQGLATLGLVGLGVYFLSTGWLSESYRNFMLGASVLVCVYVGILLAVGKQKVQFEVLRIKHNRKAV